MSEQKASAAPRKRRGLRIFGIVVVVLLFLLVVVYFVGTSEPFLKSVILPRVSKSMNANVTVEGASISPFSEVSLRNLKVVTTGSEPLLTAQEVHLRYSLMKIMGGNMVIHEVRIASPTINLIENADGSSNLDPLTKGKKEEKKAPSKSSKPPQVDLQKFVLSNATVRRTKNYKGTSSDVAEISNLNITLDNLRNGQSGKLQIGGNMAVNNNPPAPGTNGVLQAKLNGSFDFSLKTDLMPASVKGSTDLAVEKAGGSFSDISGLGAKLVADLTPTELKEVALRFQKGGAALGEMRVSGPFDTSKLEGKLRLDILSIDSQVLNLAGASKGLDFGSTTINSSNQIELAQGGSVITILGQLIMGKFAVTKAGQTTPALDLQTTYNVSVNRSANSADIQTLSLTGMQNQKQLLRGELTSPMKVSWGDNANPAGDSAFNLAITGVNLADWKPFVGDIAPAGLVGLNFKLQSQQAGKLLTFETSSDLHGLTVKVGSNSLANLQVTMNAQGTASDLNKFDLRSCRLSLAQNNQSLLALSGGGQYEKAADTADMQVVVEGNLAPAFAALGQTNATASAGKLGLNTRVVKAKETQTVTGNLALTDFTGRYGDYQFDRFGTAMDLDVQTKGKHVQIRKAAGKLTSAGKQGGAFDVSGDYNSDKKSGQFEFKLTDFNENGLRPFLQSMLGEKKLVSVTLSSSSSARLDGDDAAIKASLQFSNLVVSDPKKPAAESPLEAKLQLDASMKNKILDLRQLQATLTPTQRAKNEVQVNGKVDMSNSNAIMGNIKFAADSLDVTRYYDTFAAKPNPDKSGSTAPSSGTPSPGETTRESKPQKEPDPVKLPVRNFVIDATVGRFYLRELEITNFQTDLKLDQSTVTIQPFQMTVNGAPVGGKVNLDLGVPGYKYDVSLTAQKVPLEPLANTFAPEKRGMYKGNLVADFKVTGAGITGTSMQKNLGGGFSLNFTNANIQIVNAQLRGFLLPIATFLGAPELLNSPINQISSSGQIANGKIAITQLALVSGAFLAESKGQISIADDLMKSTFNNWPMHLAIDRALAQKVRIAPKNAPADQPYVPLPDFIQVVGTLDAPKPKLDLNLKSIAGTVLDKYGNKIPGVDQKTGNIIQGLGGILGGKTDTNKPPANTNQPATSAPSGGSQFNNLLDQFRKKK